MKPCPHAIITKLLFSLAFFALTLSDVHADTAEPETPYATSSEYEDSTHSELFAEVIACQIDSTWFIEHPTSGSLSSSQLATASESIVPTTVKIDHTCAVGSIPVQSDITPTGAKTYTIPIGSPAGINGMEPQLAFCYNSQQGNAVMGTGWSLTGIPMITRGNKSIYHDGSPSHIEMSNSDIFILNGSRLVKLEEKSDHIIYESEQGNIKAKGFYSGGNMLYFEVFYPDGKKGIFGDKTAAKSSLYYPINSLTDLYGNSINYTYTYSDNHYSISKITYNTDASIEFSYARRLDPQLKFCGGLRVCEPNLLQSVICKFGTTEIGRYDLTYSKPHTTSLLSSLSYTAKGKSYNPLKFYYGTGASPESISSNDTQLQKWYESEDPNMIKVVRGRFDYDQNKDALIMLPNKNPYWVYHQNSTLINHSRNIFENKYDGTEEIYLYTGIGEVLSEPMPDLVTGRGFIDIFCADLTGSQSENIIKVNNYVENNRDKLTFTVFSPSVYSGIKESYSRTFYFNTVYSDASHTQSIQPKFYHTGDFDGDGKMEVLAVCANEPFGDTDLPSKVYIFDLEENRLRYDGHLFDHWVAFVGKDQPDAETCANNTDKFLIFDYDGDGKSDICHIGPDGVDIYTFNSDSSGQLTPRKITSSATFLTRKKTENREVLVVEFDGDGLMDLLLTPPKGDGGNQWAIFRSMGNGEFEKENFNGPTAANGGHQGFIVQDVDGDGITDLIRYADAEFFAYITCNNKPEKTTESISYPPKSIPVPVSSTSRNSFTQLVTISKGVATSYTFAYNGTKECLMTGFANSLGVIEKNEYSLLSETGGNATYEKTGNAPFPYVTLKEPFPVISQTETYTNGKLTDYKGIFYYNAIFHRQGLGFCGFEKIMTRDMHSHTVTSVFDPYRFGVLTKETGPTTETSYEYTINTKENHTKQILLKKKSEKNLLKGISYVSSYTYDDYGYTLSENTYCDHDKSIISKKNTYVSTTSVGDGYNLGLLKDHTTTVYCGTKSYSERTYVRIFNKRLPVAVYSYKDGNQFKLTTYSYDSNGNITAESTKEHKGTLKKTTHEYDKYGRITKTTDPKGLETSFTYDSDDRLQSTTDCLGGTTTYTYDEFGRESKIEYPDGTTQATSLNWTYGSYGSIYLVEKKVTDKQPETFYYDALNREIRHRYYLCKGSSSTISTEYDSYGNISRVSLPFRDGESTYWDVYTYDQYDRLTSLKAASGKETRYSYNGLKTTIVEQGIETTRTYDSLDRLISVKDPAGTVTFELAADGQPVSVTAPGGVTTTFEYDSYRRRTKLTDPSHGETTSEYDDEGNIVKETDANGISSEYEYDTFGRRTKAVHPEFSTVYVYDDKDRLSSVTATNGTSHTYAYDQFGRLSRWKECGLDGKWLQKDFTYENGKISTIRYTTQSGLSLTENYTYTNGLLYQVKLNGETTIYRIDAENAFGQPTKATSGPVTRRYEYSPTGMPTGRSALGPDGTYLDQTYEFDPVTGNLLSRTNGKTGVTEEFGYDDLNRLTSFNGKTATYDEKGNITYRSDVGNLEYALPDRPYAVTSSPAPAIGASELDFTFTSFDRPASIKSSKYEAAIDYNSDFDRVRMTVDGYYKNRLTRTLTRHYLGGCYEHEVNKPLPASLLLPTNAGETLALDSPYEPAPLPVETATERIYLFGGFYDSPAVYIKEGQSEGVYYIIRDYLGSITNVVDSVGNQVEAISYDAWGQHQCLSVSTSPTAGISFGNTFLGRGYTGHEHLPPFGLINMNARLYEPSLGRFLSPDPFVQMPDFSQNFNRFSYALNNPLCYVDEDGQFFWMAVGVAAIIGATVNVATHWDQIKAAGGGWKSIWKGATYALTGGISAGIGTAVGMGVTVGFSAMMTAQGVAFLNTGVGFISGASIGGVSGLTSGFIRGTAEALISGDELWPAIRKGINEGFKDLIIGGITGGIGGGINAIIKGRNFWTGYRSNESVIQRTANNVNQLVDETGHVGGTKKHTLASRQLRRYQDMVGDRGISINDCYRNENNKIEFILDVIDDKYIYDFKFYKDITPYMPKIMKQMEKYTEIWGLPTKIITPNNPKL